jgi:hypothetical protein
MLGAADPFDGLGGTRFEQVTGFKECSAAFASRAFSANGVNAISCEAARESPLSARRLGQNQRRHGIAVPQSA